MRKIVFFGDSLTAGYGLKYPEKESIPALISDRLKAEGLSYEVVNAGISGDTSRSALNRLDAAITGGLAGFVLELGANDFLRGHLPTEVSGNLQKIITTVRLAYPDAWILLLGIELPIWAHSVYGAGYAKIFSDLAKANPIFLVPSFLEGVSGRAAQLKYA